MNSIEASIRNTNTKGEVNALRSKGIVPAIVYGGKNQNQKISISKKIIKLLADKENFLSNILTLNIEGDSQNVLPREIKFDTISDEPIHVDFLRIVGGAKEVHGYITHGVLSGAAVNRIKKSKIKKLVITDTIENSDKIKKVKNIEVLTISNLLAEAIKRISNSTSVSDLFK